MAPCSCSRLDYESSCGAQIRMFMANNWAIFKVVMRSSRLSIVEPDVVYSIITSSIDNSSMKDIERIGCVVC